MGKFAMFMSLFDKRPGVMMRSGLVVCRRQEVTLTRRMLRVPVPFIVPL
ncbi:MAG: hypothetical protein ACXW6R_21255 [Candidatus Binatia bacterium]